MLQGICVYIKSFYPINSLPYTAVQTNDVDFTQQVAFVKRKEFHVHRIVFDNVIVFVFVFQRLNTEILC